MQRNLFHLLIAVCLALFIGSGATRAQEPNGAAPPGGGELHMAEAVMCESIDNFKPINRGVVFSVSAASVICYTDFDVVPQTVEIFHDWIKEDTPVFRKKLVLKPPRWSSVSSIKLREADQGPWRVEVRTPDGRLLSTLRFSVTE